jgi:glycosyltransferase involved in cell wall biosynthesis
MKSSQGLESKGVRPNRPSKILHAPNVHHGGGFVLLQQLMLVREFPFDWIQLDERLKGRIALPDCIAVRYVRPSLWSRLMAEWSLWRASRHGAMIVCFHGLPPLFPARGAAVVFLQNRLLVEVDSLAAYPIRVRCRIWIERLWGRVLQGRCSHYVVQTPSMAALVRHWLRCDVPVSVVAFSPPLQSDDACRDDGAPKKFDFVFVASGEPHKNHRNLLEAWRILAQAGFRPSLALTLDPEVHPDLSDYIERSVGEYGLDVVNLGRLAPEDVRRLYRSARAMIYPSTTESFGLPLVEASRFGVPILAPELDYVRDVALPAETFDPQSPTSIARAVKRFLGAPEPPATIGTAEDFLAEVCR